MVLMDFESLMNFQLAKQDDYFDYYEKSSQDESKDSQGPWKRKNLADFGVVTQCLAPTRVNDQYLTNLLLKINAKLGGLNSVLVIEQNQSIPMISKVPTIILGMDVSHGSPGQSDIPSIAAISERMKREKGLLCNIIHGMEVIGIMSTRKLSLHDQTQEEER